MWLSVINTKRLTYGTCTTLLVPNMFASTKAFGYFAFITHKRQGIPDSSMVHTGGVIVVFPSTHFAYDMLPQVLFFWVSHHSVTYAWNGIHLRGGWFIGIIPIREQSIRALLATVSFIATHAKNGLCSLDVKKEGTQNVEN